MKNNLIKMIGVFLLVIFFALILMNSSGISEYKTTKKTTLTTKEIKKFEKDVSDGKKVELKDYLPKEKDNSNNISKLTYNTSKTIGVVLNKIVTITFKSIEKTMTD